MRYLFLLSLIITTITSVHALIINEVMSNPTGDDNGREWIEIYNATENSIDLSALTISVKGGTFVPITPVSGGTSIPAHGYAIIGSTVSGATRFMQDYPAYMGPLFRSAISLVNTGVTSLEIKVDGTSADIISSYTAAKEGSSYSLLLGIFGTGLPTPGEENKSQVSTEEAPNTTTTTTQSTLPQAAPPSADIVIYLPLEKVVVAGAPTLFTVTGSTRAGKVIDGMNYTWAFGEGGFANGSSTLYRYLYPGRYIAQVEGTNGLVAGTARMNVRVVSPDITISPIAYGKYGSYIDITNPNEYDIDMSLWKITIDGVPFSFPKNTLLSKGVTRFPGSVMGFASTTISTSTIIRLLFQNQDEVIRITQGTVENNKELNHPTTTPQRFLSLEVKNKVTRNLPTTISAQVSTSAVNSVKVIPKKDTKDTRLASFFKSFFAR
jgi:hypothetical protein